MAGKTKKQKRVRAKTKKQLNDELRQKLLNRDRASKPKDEANNNAEPSPPSAETVNEDEQKDAQMMAGAEVEELELARKQSESEQETLEPRPFDPQEAITKLLGRKEV